MFFFVVVPVFFATPSVGGGGVGSGEGHPPFSLCHFGSNGLPMPPWNSKKSNHGMIGFVGVFAPPQNVYRPSGLRGGFAPPQMHPRNGKATHREREVCV